MLRKALICVCVWPWGLFTVCPLLLLLFWSPFQLVYFVPSQAASHGQRAHAYGMPKHCAAALHRPICVIFFFYIYMYTHTHIGLFLLFFFSFCVQQQACFATASRSLPPCCDCPRVQLLANRACVCVQWKMIQNAATNCEGRGRYCVKRGLPRSCGVMSLEGSSSSDIAHVWPLLCTTAVSSCSDCCH